MAKRFRYGSFAGCLATGLAIATVITASDLPRSRAVAQQNSQGNFPDTQNHWAKPFIAALTQRNILKGYPDGTYRPNRPVEREEFAAIIREAFNQKREKQIASGSVYRDVPDGYWAEAAIKEAYEMGFMSGYPGNTFRPRQPVTRAEALTSLARNLELRQRVPSTAQNTVPGQQAQAVGQSTAQQSTAQQRTRRPIVLPLAALSLMQPLMRATAAPAVAQPVRSNPQAAARPQQKAARIPASTTLRSYYDDANRIPEYAINPVAAVTRAGIVVNHPNQRLLKPTQPATRGEMAAFIHQALVNQGQLPPLTENVAASRYIVGRDAIRSNNSPQSNSSSQ